MSQSAFQRFIAELRRRHVPQTAAVYLVAAWAAIEFSDVVVPNLNGPQWVVTAVIVAAGVGFPVVLVLAWMFDWGPEGVVRTDVEGGEDRPETGKPTGAPRSTPWLAAIAVLVVGIGSAVTVAALLNGDGETGSPVERGAEANRTPRGTRPGDEADREALAPERPQTPDLPGMDSMVGRVLRDIEEGGLENLTRLGEWEALAQLGARRALGDSTREAMRELAREVAAEADLSVVIREPRNWRLGHGVPVSLAVGDTLLVSGVAVDSAGVVAVSVDGKTVVELAEPQPSVLFEARLVGRPAVGLWEVPFVVRTADGRELRTDYSIVTASGGGS